jgi:hypothetical protein
VGVADPLRINCPETLKLELFLQSSPVKLLNQKRVAEKFEAETD